MANGHLEVHDPISNHKDLNSNKSCDPKSTSDTNNMEDTTELRLLRTYIETRRSEKEPVPPSQHSFVTIGLDNKDVSPESPQQTDKTENTVQEETEKKPKKKTKGWKRLTKIFSCISPQTKPADMSPTETVVEPAIISSPKKEHKEDRVKEPERFEVAVNRIKELADEIPFIPPDVESDSPDDVEKVIGLLLREVGDKHQEQNEELKRAISGILWDYSFFERLLTTFLTRMGLLPPVNAPPGATTSPKTQIAVTCEVTSRLSAADTLPANRLLGLGARYLQENFSTWAQQQGGYEEAFYSEDEEDPE